jgi:XRE family aerobic/anaerobic benzoate catabolism transcriptional regulator
MRSIVHNSADLSPETRALAAFGEHVRALRHERGLTLAELARATGLSARYLVSLEAGDGNISLLRLFELADALSVPADVLVRSALEARAGGSPEKTRTVALVGLRGAGKSTVGQALAHATRAAFVELDARIAERAGMSLGMVFEMHGEAHFRKLEAETLEAVLASPGPLVLATGGSLVTAEATYERLRRTTHTVWLKATAEEHWERVVAQGDGRPMKGRANAMNELRGLLKSRAPLYGLADVVVDTSGLSVDAVTAEVVRRVGSALEVAPASGAKRRAPTQRNTNDTKRAR